MRSKAAKLDRELAALAARQHGVVSRRQVLALGVSASGIVRRVRGARLHPIHRGVYAVGHDGLSLEGTWMAAVLACGRGAVLSHRSAAELWRLLEPAGGFPHVSVPTTGGRGRRQGITVHRRLSLSEGLVTRRRGIPVTTPPQTLADLRRTVPPPLARRAVRQAEALGMQTGLAIAERTQSELEHLFLRLCERHGLPAPQPNVRIGPRVVDFLWPTQRVVVETDGYRYHRGSQAFEDDHDRNLDLRALGYDVVRLTYRQVTAQPERAVEAVTDALRKAKGPPAR